MLMRKLLLGGLMASAAHAAFGADLEDLMKRCAPNVHPVTLRGIVRGESNGYQYALLDNGPAYLPYAQRKGMARSFYPATLEEAVKTGQDLVNKGHIVDIGLTQVNSRHLPRLGLTVEQVLQPCANLRAGAQILTEFYVSALRQYANNPDRALIAAISAYNTGSFTSGVANGYVSKVLQLSSQNVPELKTSAPQRRGTYAGGNGVSVVLRPSAGQRRNMLLEAKFATLEVENF